MRYRKKPVVIEAVKWDSDFYIYGVNTAPDWIDKAFDDGVLLLGGDPPMELFVKTLEGTMRVEFGDYIIKGIKGELYPCKPDIFAETYEVAQ